jgi:putative flippase GtrA
VSGSRSRFVRFLVGGAVNSGATHGLFTVLSWSMPSSIAYSIAYLSGIVLSYVINTVFVFRARVSIRSAALFPSVYLIPYLFGLALLTSLIRAGVDDRLAMLAVIVVNVPLTFVLTRYVLKGAGGGTGAAPGRHNASVPERCG